jgi:sn-glycerol 3-phosphate transport system permease protein
MPSPPPWPACCGSSCFASPYGVVAYALHRDRHPWNHLLNSNHAMALIVMAAVWKQISYNFLFFLAGLQSIPRR